MADMQPTDKELEEALSQLESSHVQNNKHRLGALGAQNIDRAIAALRTGRQAIPASASEAVPAGWISVNDRLPTEADYGDHGDVVVRYRYTDTPGRPWEVGESFHEAGRTENSGWCMGSCYYAEVTHWIPKDQLLAAIPAPASGEGQQGYGAAKHWHDLYRKECRLRQDDAARYGQKIVDLEAPQQQAGQAVAYCDPTNPHNYGAFSWPGTGRNVEHNTPLYTTPQTPDGYVLVPRERLTAIHSALDRAIGDTDPYTDPDATDDEVRDEQPTLWAAHNLALLIAASEASGREVV